MQLNLIDTHTHLYAQDFDADRTEMVKRAIEAGVSRLYLPNIDVHSVQPMLNLVWQFPDHCFPMMGLHPCSVDEHVEAHLFQLQKWFKKRAFYAVGEIGLDFYWSTEFKEQQIMAFKKQMQWAIQYNLPVVIHSREATQTCIDLVGESLHPKLRGVFHCFSGTVAEAQQIVDLGFYLGIGGVLTYKNSGLSQVLESIPVEKMVLETDAPYLAPVPYRGKRNESAYLTSVCTHLAKVKGMESRQVAEQTTINALHLFGSV